MTVVTEVENALNYGLSTPSSAVRRPTTTRHFLPTTAHRLRQQMPHTFGKPQSRHMPVVPIAIIAGVAIIAGATVVAVGAATVIGYFLLAREEGEFTEQ
jgi:hypothetical protein